MFVGSCRGDMRKHERPLKTQRIRWWDDVCSKAVDE